MSDAIDDQARTWGMVCHLSALAMFTCIPFANILGPLIVWLIKRGDSAFVDDQGKEAVNFQITIALIGLAIFILSFIVPAVGYLGFLILLANLVLIVMASLQAKAGTAYRYPFALRLIT